MKLSIIVPAFNEEKLLPATLAAIRESSAVFAEAAWQWELIVCDNNSTDRTADVAREAGAAVVFEPVNQIARARNSGAAVATGEWLLFVDADSTPHRELFERVAELVRSERVLAGGCVVRTDVAHALFDALTGLWNQVSQRMKWMAGSFVFCRAEAFRTIGGFDERLYASEELDLSGKLKRLARQRRQEVVIIADQTLLTSGRKVRLYSKWELLALQAQSLVLPWLTMHRRQSFWYDGRR